MDRKNNTAAVYGKKRYELHTYMNSRARALDELRKMMLLAASSLDDIQKEIADRKHLKI
jgi:hypothetical protein